jgi:hypothetical protein
MNYVLTFAIARCMKAGPAPQDPSCNVDGGPTAFQGVNGMRPGLKQDFAGNGKRVFSVISPDFRAGLATAAADDCD